MSVNTSPPCHYNTSTVRCQYTQKISEETEEHVNMIHNGQKKVELMQTQWKIGKETGEHANTVTNRHSGSDSCRVGPSHLWNYTPPSEQKWAMTGLETDTNSKLKTYLFHYKRLCVLKQLHHCISFFNSICPCSQLSFIMWDTQFSES